MFKGCLKDKSLSSKAWNDYSLAPFARDVSSVLRSSWFSGLESITHLLALQKAALSSSPLPRFRSCCRTGPFSGAGSCCCAAWPRNPTRSLKSLCKSLSSWQDCLLPEVSRATLATYQCDTDAVSAHSERCKVRAWASEVSATKRRWAVRNG